VAEYNGTAVCSPCQANFYSEPLKRHACLACPAFSTTLATGSGLEGCLCAPGYGSANKVFSGRTLVSFQCVECSPGEYKDDGFDGAATSPQGGSCLKCPLASFKNASGAGACTQCASQFDNADGDNWDKVRRFLVEAGISNQSLYSSVAAFQASADAPSNFARIMAASRVTHTTTQQVGQSSPDKCVCMDNYRPENILEPLYAGGSCIACLQGEDSKAATYGDKKCFPCGLGDYNQERAGTCLSCRFVKRSK
jgi:hypothetical protein